MPRRKRVLDDGDDSDASLPSDINDIDFDNDPDAREERSLFENPYHHKRRRKNGREDAIYGVFGDDSDDDDYRTKGSPKEKRTDWTKVPAFVSGAKKPDLEEPSTMDVDKQEEGGENMSEEDDQDDGSSEGESETGDDEYASDGSPPPRPPSPRIQVEEDEEAENRPGMSGIDSSRGGIGSLASGGGIGFSKGGIGSSKGGIGSSRGGIGSARATVTSFNAASTFTSTIDSTSFFKAEPEPQSTTTTATKERSSSPTPSTDNFPASFGGSHSQRFNRSSASTPQPANLSREEMIHFSTIQSTFGARMLAKMGWQAGTGLGASGEGIVTPIESKLRPQKMGIAFRGFKEKTAQSKAEARRRGEVVSDDEEDEKVKRMRRKQKKAEEKRSDVWKRPKKVKTKIEHKSYEQIIAEAGQEPATSGIGQIIDATGAVPREVSSLADVSLNTWSPTNDLTRIPEVRHNIQLIADSCKTDLDSLAREARALEERKKWITTEDSRLRKKVESEAELIARLQQIQIVTNDINNVSKELSSVYEVSLESFSPLFHELADKFASEFDKYKLDEIVIAAIAPVVRRMVANWDPLGDPAEFVSTFRGWRKVLKVDIADNIPQHQIDVYGARSTVAPAETEKLMTPFESLLWNIWLPKVRTSINNDWSPDIPQPAVKLFEYWSTLLPPFIRDNLLDQLILPKVQKTIADWSPKRCEVSLQSIVFPWLPHVGLRLEDILGDARRKVKSLLKAWNMGDEKPKDLLAWKDVFDAVYWDDMMLNYVVPKLAATLRDNFNINPRNQQMEPLEQVLQWSDTIRPSVFSQILEKQFFPKWLHVLHFWLTQPKVSFEEVAQWYSFWKQSFPESVQNMQGVSRGFTSGLQLMNKAIELGPEAPSRLSRPDFASNISVPSNSRSGSAAKLSKAPLRPSARTQEITFRSIVEDFAVEHNLLFIPTGRAHERSRMPLFRVSSTASGRSGLLVYLLDDAVWASRTAGPAGEAEDFTAISLEEMVQRAIVVT
ncbi:GC-rich sequence DNA-binding factor-like protein-domain-containing protein [Cyathus striatus]|nr:GC-rich sequence DNA-binding factor-like protein-domain-containing protein [Cyathus striatus]